MRGPNVGGAVRSQAAWYPSRIVDRNGNWIAFSYQQHPLFLTVSGIQTSDGRSLVFTYEAGESPALRTVSDGARTWTYRLRQVPGAVRGYYYLDRVIRPDGLEYAFEYDENIDDGPGDYSLVAVQYPAGGRLTYTYGYSNFFYNVAEPRTSVVVRKASSDGGVWTFAYRPGVRPFQEGDVSDPDAESYDRTTVTTPNGSVEYWHLGYAGATNYSFDFYQGRLIRKRIGTLHEEGLSYELQKISNQIVRYPDDTYTDGIYVPIVVKREITRGAGVHETRYEDIDAYGNARRVVEQTGGYRRVSTFEFAIDPAKWLIRQKRRENVDTVPGAVERAFDANGNIQWESRYGVRTDFAYHPTGDLRTRTNARKHTWTFEDYKRGIPQRASHPEGVTLSRVVSDAGNVEQETDPENATVRYAFDGLNRVRRIERPAGNPVAVDFTANTRTVLRGAYQEVTTFDGFWSCPVPVEGCGLGSQVQQWVSVGLSTAGMATATQTPTVGNPVHGGAIRFVRDALCSISSSMGGMRVDDENSPGRLTTTNVAG